ncbi:hypothetical protein HMPREF9083_0409 [Dialister micraerophilus DSM 19965]|uniref:Uncharacterized protein n=1 Tax=Dialister micraerophilus DSM 19965 TaxID=888062 RepID=F2BW42_9FIRM|nr:hypothetical protein HMPREF9083_0409 [Dialister micraerophilus DSM 19965]
MRMIIILYLFLKYIKLFCKISFYLSKGCEIYFRKILYNKR